MVFRGMLILLSALACKGEPKRSYCEALCDWAVACAASERPDIDVEAETAECLEATRASDGSCASAEDGSMNAASAKALEPCVKAIDSKAAAGECDGFNGSVDEIKTATAPKECAAQGDDAVATFQEAQQVTVETGAELCQRYTDTFCHRAEECILGDFAGEIPQAVIDLVGGTPFQLCVQRFEPVFTNDCISNDLYKPEDGVSDVNAARQSARECVADLAEIPCADLLSGNVQGNLSPACGTSVSSPDDLAAMGTVVFDLAQEYADAAQ